MSLKTTIHSAACCGLLLLSVGFASLLVLAPRQSVAQRQVAAGSPYALQFGEKDYVLIDFAVRVVSVVEALPGNHVVR